LTKSKKPGSAAAPWTMMTMMMIGPFPSRFHDTECDTEIAARCDVTPDVYNQSPLMMCSAYLSVRWTTTQRWLKYMVAQTVSPCTGWSKSRI